MQTRLSYDIQTKSILSFKIRFIILVLCMKNLKRNQTGQNGIQI